MKATPEQRRCLDAHNNGGSLAIEATAGSGKTTTLRYLAYRGNLYGKALYTSFGKKNVEDAKRKFPSDRMRVSTNHALAFGRVGAAYKSMGRLGGLPSPGNLCELMGWSDATFSPFVPVRMGAGLVLKTLGTYLGSSAETVRMDHAVAHVASKSLTPERAIQFAGVVAEMARSVWARCIDPKDTFPVNHDVYLKAFALSRPQLGYRHIFLDEGQDTSELMIDLLAHQDDCQLCIVGDRYQAIYSWRGAMNAMDGFATDSHASLTQSFRYGPDIARVANAILSSFLETSTRVVGFPEIASRVQPIPQPRCVLARTNASLIGALIDSQADCPSARLGVVGGVTDLENLVRGAQNLIEGRRTLVAELAEFGHWGEVVTAVDEEGYQHLAPLVELVTSYGCPYLLQALARVKGNELDEASCTQLFSTAHKAKGREFPTVRLCDDFNPPPLDRDERALWNPEEGNLLYVAVTRAQLGLDISHCLAAQQALAWDKARMTRSAPVQGTHGAGAARMCLER